MQTIGERLLEARQRRGVSIREAAESTKVRGDYLAAMENNQFDSIQLADVYRRGFLKIYAKFLRLDADRMVGDFNAILAARNPGPLKSRRSTDTELPRSIEMREPEGLDEFSSGAIEVAERPDNRRKLILIGGGVSLTLLVAVVLGKVFSGDDSPKEEKPAATASATTGVEGEITFSDNTRTVNVMLTRKGETIAYATRVVTPGTPVSVKASGEVVIKATGPLKFRINNGAPYNFADNTYSASLTVPPKR